MSASRPWNLSILQLLLLTALCGLLAGLVAGSRQQSGFAWPEDLAFSPDGRWLVAGYHGGQLRTWDLTHPRPVARRTRLPGLTRMFDVQLDFIDNTTLAVMSSADGLSGNPELLLWDVARNREVRRVQLPHQLIYQHAVSADGLLAVQSLNPDGRTPADVFLYRARDGVLQQRLRSVQAPFQTPYCVFLQFSADGSKLVGVGPTPGGDALVQIWDIATGESRTVTLLANVYDGRWLAVSPDAARLALYGHEVSSRVEVWDMASGERLVESVPGGGFLGGLDYSPDGRFIVDWGRWGQIRILDAASGKVVAWETIGGGRLRSVVAVSPDSRTLAVASNQAVSLWDAASLKHRRDLHRNRRALIGGLYSAGLLAWAVLWGWVARRRGEEEMDPSGADGGANKLPPAVQAGLNPWAAWLRLLVAGLLLSGVIALAFANRLARLDYSGYLARVSLLVLLVLVGLVLLRWTLLYLPALYRRWRGFPYRGAIRRAARIAEPADCRIVRAGPVSAAFLGHSHLEATFAEDYEAARQAMSELLGEPVAPQRPLTVLVFEREEWFNAHLQGRLPLGGVYWMGLDRQIMICEENCFARLTEPRQIWQVLLVRYLFEQARGFPLPGGLALLLSGHLLLRADRQLAPRVHRRLQVARRRADMPLDEDPLCISDTELARRVLGVSGRESSRGLAALQAQCYSLAEYLLGEQAAARRDRFLRFLSELCSRRSDVAQAFARQFGPPAEFRQHWQAWAAEQPTAPVGQPPAAVAAYACRVLLPLIRDENAGVESRAEAIRSLGSAGYEIGGGALIEVAEQGSPELRQDALWALEMISGREFGADLAAWRQWWAERQPLAPVAGPEADEVYTAALAEPGEEPLTAELVQNAAEAGENCAPHTGDSLTAGQLLLVWTLLLLGGVVAVVWGAWWSVAEPPASAVTGVLSIVAGVYAVTRRTGRRLRGLRTAGYWLMLTLLACNVVSALLGLLTVIQLRGKRLP